MLKTVPLLILTVAGKYFSHNGKPNRHAWHDVGLAMGNLTLQATTLGQFVRKIAGFSAEKARGNLQITNELDPVAMVAVGNLDNPEQSPGRPERRRVRAKKQAAAL